MAAAVSIAPTETDMVIELRGYSQRMIRTVAATGSGAATPDVLAFQQAWNRNSALINSLLKKLGSNRRWFKLVEDGQYGPNTGTALCTIICGPVPNTPSKASAMPVWAVQHADAINGLSPPSAPPVMPELDGSMPPLPPHANEVPSSGGVIRDYVPVEPPSSAPPPSPPVVISTTSSHVGVPVSRPVAEVLDAAGPATPIQELTEQELAALEVDTGFEGEPITILTARPRNRVPWVAAGAGAAVLGGLMYWWVKRKKRR